MKELEYYSRLLLALEAIRLTSRTGSFAAKLATKEDDLRAAEDSSAADFGDAAYRISDGLLSGCEILLQSAVRYGHQQLHLPAYDQSEDALSLLVEELLTDNAKLDYYVGTTLAASNNTRAHVSPELINLEETERRFQYKRWRKQHRRSGADNDLFKVEWLQGTEGRPPLRETVPWLEAWLYYQEGEPAEGYVTVEP